MKNKTKELKIVLTEFMSFSQKNDQESPGWRILLKICQKRIFLACREISQSLLRNLNEIFLDFFFPHVAGRGISSNGRALA